MKYCPLYLTKPFASLEAARSWVASFIQWYNHAHLHSGIRFTTPASRHDGTDTAMLHNRDRVYQAAQRIHPARWSGATSIWTRIARVTLNGVNACTPSTTTEHRRTAAHVTVRVNVPSGGEPADRNRTRSFRPNPRTGRP